MTDDELPADACHDYTGDPHIGLRASFAIRELRWTYRDREWRLIATESYDTHTLAYELFIGDLRHKFVCVSADVEGFVQFLEDYWAAPDRASAERMHALLRGAL